MTWIASVEENILSWKGLKVEDYVNDLQELATPIDQLGLLIIARMYHRHFAVFMKDGVWSTHANNSIENCAIYFAYNRGSSFLDTVEVEPVINDDNVDEFLEDMKDTLEPVAHAARRTSPPHIYGDNYDDGESTSYGPLVFPGNSPSYSTPEESTSSSESNLLPSPSKQRRLSHSTKESTSSSKLPLLPSTPKSEQSRLQKPGKTKPKVPSKHKPKKANKSKAARRAQAMKALEKAREAKRKKNLEKIKLSELKAEKDRKDSELKDRFNCSNVSIDLEKCDDQLDVQKAKPTELKEQDPILDHVAHENPDQVDLLTENDNKSKSRGTSKISETEHETSDGKLKCTGYGLKKPKKQEKKLKCPDTNCDQIFPYVKS